MSNKQTVREEFIFKGSDEDFKRLMQGDEIYELFREMNKRDPPLITTPNPFLSPHESTNIRYIGGGNFTFVFRAESIDSTRVIVVGEGDVNWLKEWKSNLEKQGLLIPILPKNEFASIQKLIPKKQKTLQFYKKVWMIWLIMNKQYQLDVLDGRTMKSKPTWEDFRDRVISDLGLEQARDPKTLQNIVRLGEAGYLD